MFRKLLPFLVAVLLLGILACSPSEPELPQWDISIDRIPLLGPDTLIMGEQIEDDNLNTDSDSLFVIEFNGDEQIEVSDQMQQEAVTPDAFEGTIGNFEISGNSGETTTFGIFDIFPHLSAGSQIIAPVTITPVSKDISMDNFSSATFVSGQITIDLTNNMPFDFGAPISIALYDVGNSRTVSTVLFLGEISSNGGTEQTSIDLAGETLSNSLRVILSGDEDGTGSAVTLSAADGVSIDVGMENLVASSANAQIPAQEFSITDAVDINTDSMKVISADISSGTLNLSFSSDFDFDVTLDLSLPQIVDGLGTAVSQVINIPANTSNNLTAIDLAGKTLNLSGGSLNFDIDVDIPSSGLSYRQVDATDKITTQVSTTTLEFSSVTADLDLDVDFPSFQEEVVSLDFDLPDINFTDITFTLDFVDNPADMDIDMTLRGTKEGSADITANYNFSITGGMTNIVVLSNDGVTVNGLANGTGSGIVDVINLLPEYMEFSGSAHIDDDNATLTGDPILISYTVDVPFIFSIPDGAVLEGDVDTLDIEDDTREKMRENFKGSTIDIVLANGLPIGGSLRLRVAEEAEYQSIPEDQWQILSSFTFDAAETNDDGDVVHAPDQEVSVGLTEEQVLKLADSEYLYWEVELDAVTIGKIKSTDAFYLRAGYLSGTMRINNDLFDDDNNDGGSS